MHVLEESSPAWVYRKQMLLIKTNERFIKDFLTPQYCRGVYLFKYGSRVLKNMQLLRANSRVVGLSRRGTFLMGRIGSRCRNCKDNDHNNNKVYRKVFENVIIEDET